MASKRKASKDRKRVSRALQKYVRAQIRNPRKRNQETAEVALPTEWTEARFRVDPESGEMQILTNPSRFSKCVASMSKRKGVTSPRGLCAYIGRKKYGAKKFAAMARNKNRKKR